MMWNTLVSGPNALQIAEAGTFLEARLPLAGLGLAPGTPLGIEFWITRVSPTAGPLDAVCNDAVQLSTPGGTNFSVGAPVPMTCLVPYTVVSPSGFISRAQATQLVIKNVILPGPNPTEVVGFLYQRTGPDSLLPPGTVLAPFDSSFIDVLPRPTYLFWIDDEPDAFFTHPVRFVLCDGQTGQLDVRVADTWPVVNGNDVLSFLQLGNASPDRIHGSYLEGGVLYDVAGESPPAFKLERAAPNPFRSVTNVSYSLPAAAAVRIAAYDVGGRLVDVLVHGPRPAGEHTIRWSSTGLASGSYFLRMESGGKASMRKVIRLP